MVMVPLVSSPLNDPPALATAALTFARVALTSFTFTSNFGHAICHILPSFLLSEQLLPMLRLSLIRSCKHRQPLLPGIPQIDHPEKAPGSVLPRFVTVAPPLCLASGYFLASFSCLDGRTAFDGPSLGCKSASGAQLPLKSRFTPAVCVGHATWGQRAAESPAARSGNSGGRRMNCRLRAQSCPSGVSPQR